MTKMVNLRVRLAHPVEDAKFTSKIRNENREHFFSSEEVSTQMQTAFLEKTNAGGKFFIVELDGFYEDLDPVIMPNVVTKKIGTASLTNYDWISRKCELGHVVLDKEFRRQGYGSEAIKAILEIAFGQQNVNKVYLQTFTDRTHVVEFYKKIGFKEEGVLRDEVYKNGKYHGVVVMSMLRKDYYKYGPDSRFRSEVDRTGNKEC